MATIVTSFTTINGMLVHEDRGGVETEYVSDPLGSLVQCRNSSGTKTYEAQYWPYGELQTSTGTNPSSWGYVGLLGYLVDSATMLYARARYLTTKFARWLTVDPLWPKEKAYVYVNDSPAFMSDWSGMQSPSSTGYPGSGGGSGTTDQCDNACSDKSFKDISKCLKEFRKCRSKFFWLPYYCETQAAICLAHAKADLEKCIICCINNFGVDGEGDWVNLCFGSGNDVYYGDFDPSLRKKELAVAL